jgi:hypothetical protein
MMCKRAGFSRAILETHPDVTEDVVNERLAGRPSRQAELLGNISAEVANPEAQAAVLGASVYVKAFACFNASRPVLCAHARRS